MTARISPLRRAAITGRAIALGAVALALSAGASLAVEFMTQEELLATIPGHSIHAKTNEGVPWVQTYSKGKKKGKVKGKMGDQTFESIWFVKGDQWCEDWGDGSACWDVERVDENSLRMYENGKPRKHLWKVK